MGDLSETLWYQDDQGGWYTGWGALTKGKFVLWMGGCPGAMAIPGVRRLQEQMFLHMSAVCSTPEHHPRSATWCRRMHRSQCNARQ